MYIKTTIQTDERQKGLTKWLLWYGLVCNLKRRILIHIIINAFRLFSIFRHVNYPLVWGMNESPSWGRLTSRMVRVRILSTSFIRTNLYITTRITAIGTRQVMGNLIYSEIQAISQQIYFLQGKLYAQGMVIHFTCVIYGSMLLCTCILWERKVQNNETTRWCSMGQGMIDYVAVLCGRNQTKTSYLNKKLYWTNL